MPDADAQSREQGTTTATAVNPGRNAEWRARLEGLVPAAIGSRCVLIVGCGSVGSFIASELARSGVSRFMLIDPDRVEWPNLTRTVFGHADVGRPKVEALADQLRTIFPDLEVTCRASRLQEIDTAELVEAFSAADLVISAVDDPQAAGRINRFAYGLDRCAMFVGIYRGAQGGEVIVSLPGITPCMACATGGRRHLEGSGDGAVDRPRDYGTNRLVAEIALGSDIHLVCAAGVKLALSFLCSDDPQSTLGQFATRALERKTGMVILGMEPDYFVFPRTHSQALGQFAFQSIWLSAQSRSDCMVCGAPEFREPVS